MRPMASRSSVIGLPLGLVIFSTCPAVSSL
jgi:hypothetical protein